MNIEISTLGMGMAIFGASIISRYQWSNADFVGLGIFAAGWILFGSGLILKKQEEQP